MLLLLLLGKINDDIKTLVSEIILETYYRKIRK